MNLKRLVASLGVFALAMSIFAQTDSSRLVEIKKEPSAEMFRSTSIGPKSASDLLHLAVSLPPRDAAGMQRFADAVSDPRNPLYRRFISPEEVGQRFGLPAYRVEGVRSYLASHGMHVTTVSKNRLSILVDATVAQAEAAFHTSIQSFKVAASEDAPEAIRFSFTTPPSMPAELARDVIDICGMDSFTRPVGHTALTATQIRTLYSAATMYGSGGNHGAGRTIAISNYDGYRISNIALECSLQSLPTPSGGAGSNVTIETVSGGTGSTGTATGEGDLDIQAVLCTAPLANVIIYDNYNTSGENPIAVLTQEVNDNKADIITESYGWSLGTSGNLSAHNQHLSMTAQGITYMAAAGDHGTTWTVNGVTYNYPAIEPEVLSVGGTSVTVNTSGVRTSEVGWNSSGDFGGGGWSVTTDSFNTRPTYQSTTTFLAGAGVPSAASVPYRLVPDISFDADPNTGYLIYVSGSESQYGGTSASSPTCAGMLANLEEQLITDGALTANSSGKYRLGRIQDLLYSFNGLSSVFFDVTSGTNGTLPNGVVSEAGPGWDTDTGWGAIIFSGLQAQIEKGVSSITLSPSTVIGGASSTATVTLSVAAPSGGAVVTLTSSNTADATVPASVTVAAGATSVTFSVTSLAVTSAGSATISAKYNGISQTAVLTVNPAAAATLSSVSLSASSVVGGCNAAITGTVTLSGPAGTGGVVVTLSSSSTSATTVPASVTVAAGATTATFSVTHKVVTSSTSVTITGTLTGSSKTAKLTVNPFTISSISLSPSTVVGGKSSTGTVTLNAVPGTSSGAITVKLSSSSTSASVPASVSVAVGSSTATFTTTTATVTRSTSSTITGTQGSSSATAKLTINS